ncbi:acyl-CoA dehydrogenase family protein [Kribbella sp. NPDC003557]|uniref:acyl-CoA dehydrogenase family protein n=1 Tax=Kribbella sp. NPDC003557 TaxID=3154449 RepID=UPI0033AF51BE
MRDKPAGQKADSLVGAERHASLEQIYTIFEGTSEIQRLVIARAISGMRIR